MINARIDVRGLWSRQFSVPFKVVTKEGQILGECEAHKIVASS